MVFKWFKKDRPVDTLPEPAATPAPVAPVQLPIPTDKIAARAYEIWVRKGRPHGQDFQNWVDAEAELRAEAATAEPARRNRKPR